VPDDPDRPASEPTAPLPSSGSAPGSRAARRQHRRRRLIALTAVAAVVVIGGAVAAAFALSGGGGGTTHRASTTTRRTAASSTLPTTLTTAPTSTTIVPRSSNPVVALAQQYDGLYVGTFTNTTSHTMGSSSLEVRIDPSAGTLHVILDITGDLYGGGDAKQVRHVDGTIQLSTPNAPITFQTASFGMVTGKLNGLSISFTAPNVPDPKVQTFELDGSLRSDLKGFDATFKIGYRNGQTGQGVASVLCAVTGQRPSQVRTLCSP
jgi:hypothetical protein